MTNENERRGAEAIVREIPATDAAAGFPCRVRAEAAGGACRRPSTIKVYGLPFCPEHGAEARSGAL